MRLSGSNYGMPQLSLDEALAFHAEVGFRAMELTVIPGYTTDLSGWSASDRRQVRASFERHGVVCSGVANFQSLIEPEPAAAELILARHRAALDLASELAFESTPPVVVFYSGGQTGDWPAARDVLVERIAGLAD